jgi:predicted transcriptional regulator
MLAHFVHEARLTEQEIAELRRILDDKEAEARAVKPRPRKGGS